jgi:hypothetical protein
MPLYALKKQNAPFESIGDHCRVFYFLLFIDHIISHLNSRFSPKAESNFLRQLSGTSPCKRHFHLQWKGSHRSWNFASDALISPEKAKQELEPLDGLSLSYKTRTKDRIDKGQLQLVLIIDHDPLSWLLVHYKSLLSVLVTVQSKSRSQAAANASSYITLCYCSASMVVTALFSMLMLLVICYYFN